MFVLGITHLLGGVVVVKNISENMQKLGHEVKVYATDPSMATPRSRVVAGVELRIYPSCSY